ncbi:unnamed protein product [Adineta steineri]|uniref:UBC core domain-containing protein n=1 Tax=Adineta steineri TaxID=433720 RepID=A0A819YG61_9BILA|nr:unnamed protein product [Adineta steineri]CAF1487882.1 unnamed protein product [Adineta steineri]CAF3920499.1 unnamed protein product [Adineta steineri]CAF4148865.1 unnamed protein product [Adineta steineri]
MHSRAYLLIKRDLYLLENNPVNGIDIERIVDDNYFDLTLFLRPLKSSMWYGCMFRIFCLFYDTYNVQPPILQFDPINIPYHPNVDPITGRISLSTSENWNPNFTLRTLFDELIGIFTIPNQKTIINTDANRILKCRTNDYQDIIDNSIEKSRQLIEIINEEKQSSNQIPIISPKGKDVIRARLHTPERGARRQQTNFKLNQRISFEDYLSTWKGIATSKANLQEENLFLKQLNLQPKLQAQHLALNANELAQQLEDRAHQFERLKYGQLTKEKRQRKTKPMSQMSVPEQVQQVHIVTEVDSSLDIPTNIEKQEDNSIKNDEIDEVDELIEWTQCLPTTDEIIEEDLSIL